MGGAADLPQRSSSPLKRRASDLEEVQSSQKDDVDMINVPEPAPPASIGAPVRPTHPQRAQSIDMLRDEVDDAEVEATAFENEPKTGSFIVFHI